MSPVTNLNMHKFEIDTLAIPAYIFLRTMQKMEEFVTG